MSAALMIYSITQSRATTAQSSPGGSSRNEPRDVALSRRCNRQTVPPDDDRHPPAAALLARACTRGRDRGAEDRAGAVRGNPGLAAVADTDDAIRSTLLAGSTLPIRVYTEYLGLSRSEA